jgi:hypothetical protein
MHLELHRLKRITMSIIISAMLGSILLLSCQGGEPLTPDRKWVDRQTNPTVAGEPIAGEPIAGEPIAGEPIAGEPIAGEPIAPPNDCGLHSSSSSELFAQTPLHTFASSCATSMCHDVQGFRIFKLSFTMPENGDQFSIAQIEEGLDAVEPFITIGQGEMSIISNKLIDGHSIDLDFNDQSPEYLGINEWIDQIPPCP